MIAAGQWPALQRLLDRVSKQVQRVLEQHSHQQQQQQQENVATIDHPLQQDNKRQKTTQAGHYGAQQLSRPSVSVTPFPGQHTSRNISHDHTAGNHAGINDGETERDSTLLALAKQLMDGFLAAAAAAAAVSSTAHPPNSSSNDADVVDLTADDVAPTAINNSKLTVQQDWMWRMQFVRLLHNHEEIHAPLLSLLCGMAAQDCYSLDANRVRVGLCISAG